MTPVRQGDLFVYPHHAQQQQPGDDCYDMPRSLVPAESMTTGSNYQAPRPHHLRQLSVDNNVMADYDVPRPHPQPARAARTLSVDSRSVSAAFPISFCINLDANINTCFSVASSCEYDIPRPASMETYDSPRLIVQPISDPAETYSVPNQIHQPFVATTTITMSSARSSGVSLDSSTSSSSTARSGSSESLSLSSTIGRVSGRSSRSSIGVVDQQQTSFDMLYDVPPSAVKEVQPQLPSQPVQEENYDVPKAMTAMATKSEDVVDGQCVYDVPPPPTLAPVPNPVASATPSEDEVPPQEQPSQTYDCPKPVTLPLALDSAMETLERLDAEVSSAVVHLLNFWQTTTSMCSDNGVGGDWAELQLRVLRLRASLQELCDFARGAIANVASRRKDEATAIRLIRLLKPLQDANSIVQKTSQGWTDLFATSKRRPSSGHDGQLDQLLACCRNMGDDMRQV